MVTSHTRPYPNKQMFHRANLYVLTNLVHHVGSTLPASLPCPTPKDSLSLLPASDSRLERAIQPPEHRLASFLVRTLGPKYQGHHLLRRSEPTAADIFAASGRQPIRAREQEKEILAHLRGCRCTGMCGPHPGDLCRGRNLAQRWTRAGVLSEGRSRHRQEASCTDE